MFASSFQLLSSMAYTGVCRRALGSFLSPFDGSPWPIMGHSQLIADVHNCSAGLDQDNGVCAISGGLLSSPLLTRGPNVFND